jgi:DNA-binding response OmpR family regulator
MDNLTKTQSSSTNTTIEIIEGNILVVDDTPASLDVLLNMLDQYQYRVRVTTRGSLVFKAVRLSLPDLILLDIQMPEMSGYEVCEQLKADPTLKHIPVIFISASDEVFDKVKAFRVGAVDYITKPFQFEEVLVRIETQLKIARLQKEVVQKANQLEKKNQELEKKNQELVQLYKKANLLFSAFSETLTNYEIGGKYLLKDKIGKGGNGVVYKAVEMATNNLVAVKIFRPSSEQVNPETIKRLNLEGLSAIRVNHPNVIKVLDFGVAEECLPYLVTELLRGYTLRDEIDRFVHLPLPYCIEILLTLCEVLDKMHSIGIIHRDIKPENIFVHQSSTGNIIKVLDFGIAKIQDNNSLSNLQKITHVGNILGTPAYVAPERLLGFDYDSKVDIYSLGIMAYLMFTGKMPFEVSTDFYAMAHMQLNLVPTGLRKFDSTIPEALEDVILSTINKYPQNRPTAIELAKELEKFLEK